MALSLSRVAFWLVPESSQRKILNKLIAELAGRFATVSFVPHVTVYSCRRSVQQKELSVLCRLASRYCEIELDAESVTSENRLTQALMISFKNNQRLGNFHRKLHEQVPLPSNYVMRPHLSLLYQDIPLAPRKELVDEIRIEMTKVCFQEVWAVAIPDRIVSLPDLLNWQTLLTCRLASNKNIATI